MRTRLTALAVAAATVALVAAGSSGARPGLPELGMAGKRSVTPEVAGYLKQHGPKSVVECTKALSAEPAQIIDCDTILPNNEPDIELKAGTTSTIVASSNDYDSCCDAFNTSLDGGVTWANGNMSRLDPRRTGSDPVTVYDAKHAVWLHSSLNYLFNNGGGGRVCDGDLVVSPSRDGLVWDRPTIVSDGVGCDTKPVEVFNDKEWIAVDNNVASPYFGRAYLTWTAFFALDGAYQRSPILFSYSDDGGATWSAPKEISGTSASLCEFQSSGAAGECDENQFSVPAVMPDGRLAVAFENSQDQSSWSAAGDFDDQYLVVRSSNGGASWSAPVKAVDLVDGAADYPVNEDGRQSLSGYQLRVNSAGNIAASPTQAGTLAIVFSDNRAGSASATNTNVYAVFSANGGLTWGAPVAVDTSIGDQWFPWVDVNPKNGKLGILYNDRGASNGALYNATVAEGTPGSLVKTKVSAAPSNPTKSRFFKAAVAGCETCATFNGDYVNIAYGSNGKANMVWTDMSKPSDVPGLFSQFVYYAQK